ncbi:MAG: T9SS type A sorting domain-containing protein [Chitinophagales bacterium]
MKNLISTFILSIALSMFAFGQVTITQDNFPRPIVFIDTFYSVSSPQNPLPSEGANQQWDYSNFPLTDMFGSEYFDASADVNFPNAHHKQELNISFQGFPLEGFQYFKFEANGWGLIGKHTNAVEYSLQAVSSPNDTLYFPENIDVYTGEVNSLEFPATYQTNWSGTRYETTPFALTVSSFGLQNDPGERIRSISDNRDVVGYGKLIIPDDNGDPSSELDVLLIKSVQTVVDSYFLMGSPAPQQLLDAFQLTQGASSTSSAYLFYMPDYGKPIMRLGVNGMGTGISSVGFRPDAARTKTTSLSELSFDNSLDIYPNPVNAGQSIMINFNTLVENAEISLMDIAGRKVHHDNINLAMEFTKFNVPDLSPGVYILNVSAQNGALNKNSKILIE